MRIDKTFIFIVKKWKEVSRKKDYYIQIECTHELEAHILTNEITRHNGLLLGSTQNVALINLFFQTFN